MMETQADQLASDFLVPPQYDLNRLAELSIARDSYAAFAAGTGASSRSA